MDKTLEKIKDEKVYKINKKDIFKKILVLFVRKNQKKLVK